LRFHVCISLKATTSKSARIIPLPKELKDSFPTGSPGRAMHILYAPTCSIYMHLGCMSSAPSSMRCIEPPIGESTYFPLNAAPWFTLESIEFSRIAVIGLTV
jgi:hypothetical protein